jgi:hypothetical protein
MRDKFYTIIEGLYTPSINLPAWQITLHVHIFRPPAIVERLQVLRAAGTGECKTNRGSRTFDGSVRTSCFEPGARQYSIVKPLTIGKYASLIFERPSANIKVLKPLSHNVNPRDGAQDI